MAWNEPLALKLRRRAYSLRNRIAPRRHDFVCPYLGADFLLQSDGVGALEISAGIAEREELQWLLGRCAELQPTALIDVGANIGLYSCVLLRNHSVPRAVLFEPNRATLIRLKANLLINRVLDRAEVHELALGDTTATCQFAPSAHDSGLSKIVDSGESSAYQVKVARLDDVISLSGEQIAIKIDIEGYECRALTGMHRLLSNNRCVVQIEAFETCDTVHTMMAEVGYRPAKSLPPNYIFETA
jgi:FkbM family methyltransferase